MCDDSPSIAAHNNPKEVGIYQYTCSTVYSYHHSLHMKAWVYCIDQLDIAWRYQYTVIQLKKPNTFIMKTRSHAHTNRYVFGNRIEHMDIQRQWTFHICQFTFDQLE
jgi:hypothetical protein